MRCLSALLFLIAPLMLPAAATASVLDDDPFVPDAAFNDGYPVIESFHTPEDFDRPGRRVLRLAGGDLVVAADIRLQAHAADGSSIALARYLPDGRPMHWENASSSDTVSDGMALVWPAGVGGFPANAVAHRVLDLKQIGDRILVLYSRTHPTPVNHQIMLEVFDDWGGRISSTVIESAPVLPRGAQMAPYRTLGILDQDPTDRVLIAMPVNVGSSQTPQWELAVSRYRFADAQAAPTPDDGFNAGQAWRYYSLPGSCANHGNARHGDDLKLALSGDTFPPISPANSPPRLFLANTLTQNNRQDIAVLGIDARNSQPLATFGSGTCSSGFRVFQFNDDGQFEHRVAGITMTPGGLPSSPAATLHIAAKANTGCGNTPGIALAKIDHTGAFVSSFGQQGHMVFGGATGLPGGACQLFSSHTPTALIRTGTRLAVVGTARSSVRDPGIPLPPPRAVDNPFLAIVDADTGTVGMLRSFPAHADADSGRLGDGSFADLVADGANGLAVVGEVSDERDANGWQRATVIRLVADRLFGDGFQ